jgi:hypothetical protein
MTESLKRDRFFSIVPVLLASVASAIIFFFASMATGWSRGLGLAIPHFVMVALSVYGFPPNVSRFTFVRLRPN